MFHISYTDLFFPGNIVKDKYKYMSDLQALEATASGCGPQCFSPATLLAKQAWQWALADHPDRDFVKYLLIGMECGFHIGADRSRAMSPSRQGNLPSVREHPELVAEHLATAKEAGRLLGPLPSHLANLCQVSPIGLIPKPHQPGKWRLIVDFSFPMEPASMMLFQWTFATCAMHRCLMLLPLCVAWAEGQS